jgi:hypothetical protein
MSILILIFAINVLGKMHELTEEANEEKCLSSGLGTLTCLINEQAGIFT